jgi:hypothetical protein
MEGGKEGGQTNATARFRLVKYLKSRRILAILVVVCYSELEGFGTIR